MQTGFSEFAGLAKWAIELLHNMQAYLYIVMLQGGGGVSYSIIPKVV